MAEWPNQAKTQPSARISRVNSVRAFRAGRDARIANQSHRTVPYDLNGSLGEQYLGYWWMRGWRRQGEGGASDAEVPAA